MEGESTASTRTKCLNCGFESEADEGGWGSAEHPSLGAITQCPECGSTNTTTVSRG